MALGGDFEALKRLAKQQDADRQASLAKERATRDKEAAREQAARDARERQERENSRRLLKLKEDQKKRKAEAEEELQRKREEIQRRKQQREIKAKELAKATGARVVTSKMIRQREKAGLGGRKSKTSSSASSSDYLPLTRQEKRDRREREALGLDIRRIKASQPSTVAAGPSRLRLPSSLPSSSSPSSNGLSVKQPRSNGRPISSTISPPKTTSTIIRQLEKQLREAETILSNVRSLPESKEKGIKLRDAEGVERDLRRKIAMERKAEESRQLARIRAGLPPLPDDDDDDDNGKHKDGKKRAMDADVRGTKRSKICSDRPSMDASARPETAREKFLRQEAEKKLAQETKTTKADPRARQSQGRKKNSSMHFSESEEERDVSDEDDDDEDDDDDDGFIDDEEEGGGYDIWSIMNPGKDKSKYLSRQVDSDDDMEADAESVFREDQRSSALARMEDRREEERLRKHELEKARRKQQRGKDSQSSR